MSDVWPNSKCLRYCPKCGAVGFRGVSRKQARCDGCGFELFLNAAAAVGALIHDDAGRLLITVRARDPATGTLDLPGGFVDPGETVEAAVQREVYEELNLEVTGIEFFASAANDYLYNGVLYESTDSVFVCTIKDLAAARPADDVAEIRFLAPEEIHIEDFGLRSSREILSLYLTIDSTERNPT